MATNYAFTTGKDLPVAEDGQTFEGCNFMRLTPHTKIFEGVTGLNFVSCNLMNCDVPADAKMEMCNNSQIEFCGNLHEKWLEKGITACALNCSHVTGSDLVQVAGVTVDTIYHYADKAVA